MAYTLCTRSHAFLLFQTSRQEYVYIRGSQIRFLVAPDMLKHSPIFQRFTPKDKAAVTGNLAKTAKKK